MNFQNIMGRTIAAVLVTFGLMIGAPAPTAAVKAPTGIAQSAVIDGAPVIKGGCIRLYADGPKWHVDEDHHTLGIDPTIDPVIDSSGFLTFWTESKAPVVAITPTPDETLVARGISVGGSNGSHLVRLRFYKDGVNGADGSPLDLNNPVHYSRVSGDYSNVWVTIVQDPPAIP